LDFFPGRKQTPRDGERQSAEITCITVAIGAVRHRTLQEGAIEVLKVILACYDIPLLETLGDNNRWIGLFTLSAGWEVLL
jgi:chorismate synthase